MIDNYLQIFENDNTYCIHIDKMFDGLKTSAGFIHSAGKLPIMKGVIVGLRRKICYNDEN